MTNDTMIAFDLETTGLYPIKDKIVEIGAVCFSPKDSKVINEFQMLVNPNMPIPAEVTAIHGITDEMVLNAPMIKEALPKFMEFIGDAPLVAHNIGFDVGFLMAALSQYKIAPPSNLLIDSCELSKICFKNSMNHKSDTMRSFLNLEDSAHHRAMGDSYTVMRLYKECLKKSEPGITIEEIAYRTTKGLRFQDYLFDKLEIMDDKVPLQRAIEKSESVQIRYRNGKGEESLRLITPFNIFGFKGKIYVTAHCHRTDEERQFRLDRICEVINS